MPAAKSAVFALVAVASALSVTAAAAQERAGETLRVQPSTYQRTGAYPFDLNRGDDIFRNANVFTKEAGSVRMLFIDGTDLTLGPNTDVVIDDYVYSPDSGTGQAAISLGQGVLRMVSGRMPKAGVSIDTPVATIGIRGTTLTLSTGGPGIFGWVEDGTIMAAPDQSDVTFEFAAPATFACSAAACQQTEGQGPPPAAFPPSAPNAGQREVDDRQGEEESHGHFD